MNLIDEAVNNFDSFDEIDGENYELTQPIDRQYARSIADDPRIILPTESRDDLRRDLDDAVANYLASGKQIQVVPQGTMQDPEFRLSIGRNGRTLVRKTGAVTR